MEIPKIAEALVGTKQKFSGGLFSYKKDLPEAEYDVLKWRWGSAFIIDMETMEDKHPTVEFLLKNKNMKRAQWSRGFGVREYIPDGNGGWKKDDTKN